MRDRLVHRFHVGTADSWKVDMLRFLRPALAMLLLASAAAATGDDEALRICNSAIARGAIAAGLSGSGPAIAIVCYQQGAEQLAEAMSESGLQVIRSAFVESASLDEEASAWE